MRPGPFGVGIPERVAKLHLPPTPVPDNLDQWRFHFCSPPYRTLGDAVPAGDLLRAALKADRGTFLVANPGLLRPEQATFELEWVQKVVPWCSLTLLVDLPGREAVDALVRRHARQGVTVASRYTSDPASLAHLIVQTTEPVAEVESSLRLMLPCMAGGARADAASLLRDGLRSALPHHGPEQAGAGVDRRAFFRVGRAMGAAVSLQQAAPTDSNLQVAYRAGFASDSTLATSVKRLFGVGPWPIRRTVGWPWLLWLALQGEAVRPHLTTEKRRRTAHEGAVARSN